MSLKRKSGIELLRILAIILIIGAHLSYHSDFPLQSIQFSVNKAWLLLLNLGGKFGVDIFVVISAYFLCEKTNNQYKKIINVWLELLFYSILTGVIYSMFSSMKISQCMTTLVRSFFPVITNQWWYATCYIVFLLFIPYINILIRNLKEEEFRKLVFIIIILYYIIPTILLDNTQFVFELGDLFSFFAIYIIVAYLKKYKDNLINTKKTLVVAIGSYFLLWFINLVISCIGFNWGIVGRFASINNFFLLISSVSIFYFFKNVEVKFEFIVMFISKSVFGIYLIHDSQIRSIIWETLNLKPLFESKLLIPISLLTIAAVFCIGLIIDILRNTILGSIQEFLSKKIYCTIEKTYKKILIFIRK